MSQRFIAPVALSLSLSFASLVALQPVAAAVHPTGPASTAPSALKTYVNAASHYSFIYPATWAASRAQGFDVSVVAPKGSGGIVAVSQKGTQSAARIQRSLTGLLALIAPIQGKLVLGTMMISGVPFQSVSDHAKAPNGTLSDNTAYGASYHGVTYLFLTGYDLNRAGTATVQAQLPAVVRSIRIS